MLAFEVERVITAKANVDHGSFRRACPSGAARPHLLRISGARKSVVAVTGELARLIGRFGPTATKVRSAAKSRDVPEPIHALRYDRRDACLIAVNRVWRSCWKLDTKTRSIGSARRDRRRPPGDFDD